MPEALRDILTISGSGSPAGDAQSQRDRWHEVVNAFRTGRIVSSCISGIETLADDWNVVVVHYEGYRVLIPIGEMMIDLDGDGRERADTVNRQIRIANNMLGAQIDFIIRSVDEAAGSIVASRKDAMMKKRRIFYLPGEDGKAPMIFPGRKVEARVIAVAPKVVRLEVFGIEISVRVRDMCHVWLLDAAERYTIGDVVQVTVKTVEGTAPEFLKVTVDAKGEQEEQARAELSRCCRQGKYSGIITDVYRGTYYLRLDTGVNAIAHSTTSTTVPGRGDRVGFVATRVNPDVGFAEGIITRMIRQAGGPGM